MCEGTDLCALLLLLISQTMKLLGLCSLALLALARPIMAYTTTNNTVANIHSNTNTSTTSIPDAPEVSAALCLALQYC
jgi:DMSO reductase anchor subunit